jgi:hypothetical protein
MTDTVLRLLALLRGRVPPAGLDWLERATSSAAQIPGDGRRTTLLNDFAAAPRRLGKQPVALSDDERMALLETPVCAGATVDELGRTALLAAVPVGEQVELAAECFRHGEIREKRAVLRALSLLPRPDRFCSLAIDACRSHVQPVFEAICCESRYPAAWFPDLAFRQMVLKALFVEVALDRVHGLRARIDPELVRMARDYASERSAAGRPVPADIDRYFGPPPAAPVASVA